MKRKKPSEIYNINYRHTFYDTDEDPWSSRRTKYTTNFRRNRRSPFGQTNLRAIQFIVPALCYEEIRIPQCKPCFSPERRDFIFLWSTSRIGLPPWPPADFYVAVPRRGRLAILKEFQAKRFDVSEGIVLKRSVGNVFGDVAPRTDLTSAKPTSWVTLEEIKFAEEVRNLL